MVEEVTRFLEQEVKFKDQTLAKALAIFRDNEVSDLDALCEIPKDFYIELGFTPIQAFQIVKAFEKRAHVTGEDGITNKIDSEIMQQSSDAVDQPQNIDVVDKKLAAVQYQNPQVIDQSLFANLLSQNQYLIYETYEDNSSESMMKKIRLNEDNFYRFKGDLSIFKEVKMIGLYGSFKHCLQYSFKFLQAIIDTPQSVTELEDGIIALRNQDKVAFIYKTKNDTYDFAQQKNISEHAATYIRYLIDFCEHVYAVTHETFELNPDQKTPFQNKINQSMVMKNAQIDLEEIKNSIEEIQVKEIPLASNKDQQNLKNQLCYADHSKYLSEVKIEASQRQVTLTEEVDQDLLQYGHWNQNQNKKGYSYQQVRQIIDEFWPSSNQYFYEKGIHNKFEKLLNKCLVKFIPKQSQGSIKEIIQRLQKQYTDRYNDINSYYGSEQADQTYELVKKLSEIFDNCSCKTVIKEKRNKIEGNWTVVTDKKLFNTGECTELCKQTNLFSEITKIFLLGSDIAFEVSNHFKKKNIQIHQPKTLAMQGYLQDLNNEWIKKIENLGNKFEDQEYIMRKEIIQEILQNADSLIKQNGTQKQIKINLHFNQIKLMKDGSSKNNNWSLIRSPNSIAHTFEKQESQNLKLNQVYFSSEKSGYAVFYNTIVDGKCGLYYFIFSDKKNSSSNLILVQQQQSQDSIFGFENERYFAYSNSNQIFQIGKYKKHIIDDNQKCNIFDDQNIKFIKSACFVPNHNKIMILNQESELYEFSIFGSNTKIITKNIEINGIQETHKFIPASPDDQFEEVQSSHDGKYVALRTKRFIQIYDLNWDLIFEHILRGKFLYLKFIKEDNQTLLLISTLEDTKLFHVRIKGEVLIKTEIKGKNKDSKKLGNPLFDQVYHAFKKYGHQSSFIGAPGCTQLHLVPNELKSFNTKTVSAYLKQLKLPNLDFKFNDVVIQHGIEFSEMKLQNMEIIMLSRIALHIATIENFTLVPLQNGINISNNIIDRLIQSKDDSDDEPQKADLIEKIIQMIKFGVYEQILNSHDTPVYIVSIVGKQSGGKSYVMNRLFGTRFSVSAQRCTDGIWMSLSQVILNTGETKTFIVLDCEGLFSTRRNDQEEMKLCLALSAVSDIMILNQDLSFNRFLNQLFNSFIGSVGKISGKNLFKGMFMMLIRDINGNQQTEAFKEARDCFKSILSKPKNFIDEIFGGQLEIQGLNHFEMPDFDAEIEAKRNDVFMKLNTKRWRKGKDFIESLKITLAQVFADDDTDIDQHKLKILSDKLYSQSIKKFYDGGEDFFIGDKSNFSFDAKINGKFFTIRTKQGQIKFLQKRNYRFSDNEEDKIKQIGDEHSLFENLTMPYQQEYHNEWLSVFSQFQNCLLSQRQSNILDIFEYQIKEFQEYSSESIKPLTYKLQSFFDSYNVSVKLCTKNCRICMRQCVLSQNHKRNCDCQTKHSCQLACVKTPICIQSQYKCVDIFGHEGEHRCSEGLHRCPQQCSINRCTFICSLDIDHEQEDVIEGHDCGNKHQCQEKCEDEGCHRNCKFEANQPHEVHECGETSCVHKCKLCDRKCVFPNHMHNQMIETMKAKDLTLIFEGDSEERSYNYHICDQDHICKEVCKKIGICSIDYKIQEKQWKNEFGEFNYKFFKPEQTNKQCAVIILKYKSSHEIESIIHDCKCEKKHRCPDQCPECKSFCHLDVDHENLHFTNTHRNKEQSVFVKNTQLSNSEESKTISLFDDGKKREYKIGESCQPENCTTSCQRKGRSHFHLKECSEETCQADGAQQRHSTDKYYPYEDKTFDKYLCTNYWRSYGWNPPIENALLLEAQSCSFFCGNRSHCSDQDQKMVFCKLEAWHKDDHKFQCGHTSNGTFDLLDIVFCLDVTGSMGKYIGSTVNTINRIVDQISKFSSKDKRSVLFGFVGYRDHQDEKKTFLTKHKDLTTFDIIRDYITDEITAKGGGGDGAEAVMDGLFSSLNDISWRSDSAKYIFHICDSPAHGSEYGPRKHDHYPEGCPCGVNLSYIAGELKKKKISYKLVKIGNFPNKMASIFSMAISDYELLSIDQSEELVDRVSSVIVRDLKNDEIDVLIR